MPLVGGEEDDGSIWQHTANAGIVMRREAIPLPRVGPTPSLISKSLPRTSALYDRNQLVDMGREVVEISRVQTEIGVFAKHIV